MALRILWFCNVVFSSKAPKSTGTWLFSMAEALVNNGLQLYNITKSDNAKKIRYDDSLPIKQWILPAYRLNNGLPSYKHIKEIQSIVDEISPDIIHIWGIESYWGLLTARGYIKGCVLLEMQGIRETCARVFYGGMSFLDVLSTIRIKELLKPSVSLPMQKRQFRLWSRFEREIISGHRFITTQSDWVRSWVSQYAESKSVVFHTQLMVRDNFLKASPWSRPNYDTSSPIIFTLSSEAHAFKGLHDGIRALAILKKKYPDIKLHIAGNFETSRSCIFQNGYTKYILRLIKKLGLTDNVEFLGSLDAEGLSCEMQKANVMIQTSYVESYSLALVEAQALGVPAVVSYAGAMPELAKDGKDALFYTPSDYFKLAFLVDDIISDQQLGSILSNNSREAFIKRNSPSVIIDNQINIYNEVLRLNSD